MMNVPAAVETKRYGNTEERIINSAWRKPQRINVCVGPLRIRRTSAD